MAAHFFLKLSEILPIDQSRIESFVAKIDLRKLFSRPTRLVLPVHFAPPF
jgi:hypothetical protein